MPFILEGFGYKPKHLDESEGTIKVRRTLATKFHGTRSNTCKVVDWATHWWRSQWVLHRLKFGKGSTLALVVSSVWSNTISWGIRIRETSDWCIFSYNTVLNAACSVGLQMHFLKKKRLNILREHVFTHFTKQFTDPHSYLSYLTVWLCPLKWRLCHLEDTTMTKVITAWPKFPQRLVLRGYIGFRMVSLSIYRIFVIFNGKLHQYGCFCWCQKNRI